MRRREEGMVAMQKLMRVRSASSRRFALHRRPRDVTTRQRWSMSALVPADIRVRESPDAASMSGMVVGARGQALGRRDGLRGTESGRAAIGFASSYVASNADGSFRYHVTRYADPRHQGVIPHDDTLSLYVVAQKPAGGLGARAAKGARQCIHDCAHLAREGAVPTPSNVTVRLEILIHRWRRRPRHRPRCDPGA